MTFVVVVGVPGSGTTLIMQMLEAAGFHIVMDNVRKADHRHPAGYYEYTKPRIIKAVGDKSAVKLAGLDARYIPAFATHIIVTNREARPLRAWSSDRAVKQVHGMIDGMIKKRSAKRLDIDYDSTVEYPFAAARKVLDFLGVEADTDAMARTVVASLRHNVGGIK